MWANPNDIIDEINMSVSLLLGRVLEQKEEYEIKILLDKALVYMNIKWENFNPLLIPILAEEFVNHVKILGGYNAVASAEGIAEIKEGDTDIKFSERFNNYGIDILKGENVFNSLVPYLQKFRRINTVLENEVV